MSASNASKVRQQGVKDRFQAVIRLEISILTGRGHEGEVSKFTHIQSATLIGMMHDGSRIRATLSLPGRGRLP